MPGPTHNPTKSHPILLLLLLLYVCLGDLPKICGDLLRARSGVSCYKGNNYW